MRAAIFFLVFASLSVAQEPEPAKPLSEYSPEELQLLQQKVAEIPRELLRIPMTLESLDELITSLDPDPQGEGGVWQFTVEGTTFVCMTDIAADRMRIMTPIADIREVSAEQLAECMKANYDRALDARYCVNQGQLWGAFIHPLASLTPELFISAINQVYNVRRTFGTEYSSGGIIFQHGEKFQEEKKEADEKEDKGEGV